jgi:hypothetical protein
VIVTNQDDAWLSIRDASLRLGVSELTIRRRIKSRKVVSRVEHGKYYVNLALQPEPGAAMDGGELRLADADVRLDAPDGFDTGQSALAALMPDIARLAERAGMAAALEGQTAQLQAENRRLQETLLSLTGRNGWLESRLEEREEEIKLLTDSRPRPGFWRRLFSRGPSGTGAVH